MDQKAKSDKFEEHILKMKNKPFDKYIFRECIGKGGYGCVFKLESRDGNTHILRAAKIYFLDLVPPERYDIVVSGIKYERENLRMLLHPYIITAYRCFNTKKQDGRIDCAFIIMNYHPEGDLEQYVTKNGPLKGEDLKKMLITLLIAIKFMHERNILHRDIKPQNVMLSGMESILVDFGCSINLETQKVNSYVESRGYSEPGAKSKAKMQFPTDIFSLGATAFFAATGKQPAMFVEGETFNVKKLTDYLNTDQFKTIDAKIKSLILKTVGPEETRPTAAMLLEEVDSLKLYQNIALDKMPKPKPEQPENPDPHKYAHPPIDMHGRYIRGDQRINPFDQMFRGYGGFPGAAFLDNPSDPILAEDGRYPYPYRREPYPDQNPNIAQGQNIHNPLSNPLKPQPPSNVPQANIAQGQNIHNPLSNPPKPQPPSNVPQANIAQGQKKGAPISFIPGPGQSK